MLDLINIFIKPLFVYFLPQPEALWTDNNFPVLSVSSNTWNFRSVPTIMELVCNLATCFRRDVVANLVGQPGCPC